MNEIKMSVIVPAHGRVSLFEKTLECLINQTSREFEIIITDDSSREEEREAIKKLVNIAESKNKDLEIKYIFTRPNLLQANNTNQGLKNSSGKYLRILHSDDIIAPKCIESEILAFDENPDCHFLNHSAKHFNEKFQYNSKEEIIISRFNIFDCWLKRSIFTGCVLPSSMAFTREVYLNIGGMNSQYKFACDWDFFFRILLNEYLSGRNDAIYISGGLVGWRQHDESITSTMCLTHFYENEEMIRNFIKIYQSHKILGRKDLKDAKRLAYNYRYKRLLEDYEKYGNFILPRLPLKFSKKRKYEKMSGKLCKLKRHINKFIYPFAAFVDWLIQPISIIFYLFTFLISVFNFLISRKDIK